MYFKYFVDGMGWCCAVKPGFKITAKAVYPKGRLEVKY